jgi:uncharacterized protein YdeI (BOF family)
VKKTVYAADLVTAFSAPVLAQPPAQRQRQRQHLAQAHKSHSGTHVALSANLVVHVRGAPYTLRAAYGEMRVEVDHDIWRNRSVNPASKVQPFRKVGLAISGWHVDVDSLQIAPQVEGVLRQTTRWHVVQVAVTRFATRHRQQTRAKNLTSRVVRRWIASGCGPLGQHTGQGLPQACLPQGSQVN